MKLYQSLRDFVKFFFKWNSSRDIEGTHLTAVSCFKQNVVPFSLDSPESQYMSLLTRKAWADYVWPALEARHEIASDLIKDDSMNSFVIQFSSGNKIQVTDKDCSCKYWQSLGLPCKHMLAAREKLYLPVFDKNLVAVRWTKQYSLLYKTGMKDLRGAVPNNEPVVCSGSKPKKSTVAQKSAIIAPVAREIINTLTLSCGTTFDTRKDALILMLNLWKQGKEVIVTEFSSENAGTHHKESSVSDEADGDCIANDQHEGSMDKVQKSISEMIMPTPVKFQGQPSGFRQTNITFPHQKSKKSKAKRKR